MINFPKQFIKQKVLNKYKKIVQLINDFPISIVAILSQCLGKYRTKISS